MRGALSCAQAAAEGCEGFSAVEHHRETNPPFFIMIADSKILVKKPYSTEKLLQTTLQTFRTLQTLPKGVADVTDVTFETSEDTFPV